MLIEEAEAAASFFPTTNEVVRAVQFVRENPAVVLGVVVGITSLSVARYYEGDEQDEDDQDVLSNHGPDETGSKTLSPTQSPQLSEPPRRLTRSSTSSVLTMCGDGSSTAGTPSPRTGEAEGASSAGGETQEVDASCNKMHRMNKSCSFCNQAKEGPHACCDSDWGWFIPTATEDDHHAHQHCQAAANGE